VPLHASQGERRHLGVTVLLFLSAGAAWVLWRFLWPFASGIIIAVVLAVLAYPAYGWLRRRIPHRSLAALVGTTVLFFLVLIPIAGTSMLVFRSIQGNVDSISQQAGQLVAPDSPLRHGAQRLADWVGLGDVDFTQVARDQVRQLGGFLAGSTVGIVSGLGGALLQAAVALFTLYYLLEDGPELLRGITRLVPLDEELTDALLTRSREIIFATVYGHVVVAIVEGTMAGLAWWILDLPAPVLWGTAHRMGRGADPPRGHTHGARPASRFVERLGRSVPVPVFRHACCTCSTGEPPRGETVDADQRSRDLAGESWVRPDPPHAVRATALAH